MAAAPTLQPCGGGPAKVDLAGRARAWFAGGSAPCVDLTWRQTLRSPTHFLRGGVGGSGDGKASWQADWSSAFGRPLGLDREMAGVRTY